MRKNDLQRAQEVGDISYTKRNWCASVVKTGSTFKLTTTSDVPLHEDLVETAFSLLRRGIGCHVEGNDIAQGLKAMAARWKNVKTTANPRYRNLMTVRHAVFGLLAFVMACSSSTAPAPVSLASSVWTLVAVDNGVPGRITVEQTPTSQTKLATIQLSFNDDSFTQRSTYQVTTSSGTVQSRSADGGSYTLHGHTLTMRFNSTGQTITGIGDGFAVTFAMNGHEYYYSKN